MPARLSRFMWRDVMLIVVPALLAIAGAVWLALRFADPPPPAKFVLSAATAGSPYHRFAERYAPVFARNGVTLEVRESTGSLANLKALADRKSGVNANNSSLAAMYTSPLSKAMPRNPRSQPRPRQSMSLLFQSTACRIERRSRSIR